MAPERVPARQPVSVDKVTGGEEVSSCLPIQNKIIKTLGGSHAKEDVSDAEREAFLRKLAYKEIPDSEITAFLSDKKKGNEFSEDERNMIPILAMKDKLQENAGYRLLLNILLSKPPQNSISVTRILSILETYPSPNLFEELVERTAQATADQKGAADDARRHGAALAKMLYGEKQETWEQLKILMKAGEAKYGKTFEEGGIKIRQLEEIEFQETLSRVETHGDPWQGQFLKAKDLEAEGVGPRMRIEVGGKVYFCSTPYDLKEGRRAVVGYIEDKNKKLVARTFYRSNSHGIWKYLPKYLLRDGKIGWFQKGHGEESISLPIPLQRALAYIDQQNPLPTSVENPDFVFAGTARRIASIFGDDVNNPNTYVAEVLEQPNVLDGNFYSRNIYTKVSPEKITFLNSGQAPDFSKVVSSWEQDAHNYGPITIEVFNSNDKKVRYMFCSDHLGRVWIGGIELPSPVGSTGLREQWVNGGNLTTPAFEYFDQDGGFGNAALQKGDYVDMFENYLRHIPVIKQYIAQKSLKK